MKSTDLFPTPVNGIYSCTEETAITTGNDVNVTMNDILLIPFDVENNLMSRKGKTFLSLLHLQLLNMKITKSRKGEKKKNFFGVFSGWL